MRLESTRLIWRRNRRPESRAQALIEGSALGEGLAEHRLCRQTLLKDGALEPQERLLAVEAAGVADELPVRAHDAVAREDDRQRVAVHHHSDRTRGARTGSPCGELAVRDDLAVGNARELTQDAAVEIAEQANV